MSTSYRLGILTALALAVPVSAAAQSPTATHGFRWHLAPTAQVSQVNGETSILTGVEFGWRASDRFTLGFATYRLASDVSADQPDATGVDGLEFFYGGITASYALIRMPHSTFSVGGLVGGAEAHWRDSFWAGMPDEDHKDAEHTTSLVLEPRADLEYILTPWLQVDVGGGYRWAGEGESNVITQNDMRGWFGTLGFRFGSF